MAVNAFYPVGFSPPSGAFSTATSAGHSVWSPPGIGSGLIGHQPPPYGYASSAYPSFSYNSNGAASTGYAPAAPQGFFPPQQPRYSVPPPRPGITGQVQQQQQSYAPVMEHRKPSLDLASYAPSSSSTSSAQYPYSTASAALYPQLPLARCFSQPGSFAPQAVNYDPPQHPPPGFHHHHHHQQPQHHQHHYHHEPLPPYRAYDQNGRVFQTSPDWIAAPPAPTQQQPQQQPLQGGYTNLPPRLAGLQHQKQQQQQHWGATAPASAENWNPWADTGHDQVQAQRGPTKGVGGGANYGAVGEKRMKRVDGDVKDPAIFGSGAAKEVGVMGGMDWDQLMNSVVYPEYDQPSYAQPAQPATPPPPPPPEPAPVEYQLVPASNPVLPPPPIEKSAVPLSAVGAGLIWKLCLIPGFSVAEDAFQAYEDEEMVEDSWSPWNPELSTPAAKPVIDMTQPTSDFKSFVESILTQTLLTPQVLLLALLYVVKVVARSWPLPLAEDSPLADHERAPYKMFLAGVMIANKILDDNSYRTETFAQVSGVALSELNSLEVFFLGALNWSLTVGRDEWREWMEDVKAWNGRWHPSAPGKADAATTAMLASLNEQAGTDEDPFRQRSPVESVMTSFEMPTTHPFAPHDYGVDLFQDATGPVKSPFQMQRVVAWQGANSEA